MASPANFRVRTDISEGGGPFVNLGTVWMQRQGTPEEVAALMVYLAADESAFVTAQAISINGGAYN